MADNTTAQIGSQTTLRIWNTYTVSPPAWSAPGKIRSINGYGEDLPEVESTTLDDQAVARIAGLPDGTEMNIVMTLTSATLTLIEAIDAAKTNFDVELDIPAPTNEARYFSLTPRGFTINSITPSGLIEITLNARRSGPSTDTPTHTP